jgi:iron(III) transport system ATP-binding protein
MIELNDIRKRFDGHTALEGVSVTIPTGRRAVLFGPSGCGKSTLLRIIAGLEQPDGGSISIAGTTVAEAGRVALKPEARKVGLVFQDLALFPHLTVERNIEFGVRDSAGRDERIREMLALTRLESLKGRLPHELSGGEQQRVAVARALAPAPDLLLLDEPFANLDAALRAQVRLELIELLDRVGTTSIMVTHDREEALSTAEVLLVMSNGRLLQSGPPRGIYETPADPETALLLGEGNLIDCTIEAGHGECCLGRLEADGRADGPCRLFVRSEHLRMIEPDDSSGRVEGGAYYGHDSVSSIRFDDGQLIQVRQPHGELPDTGTRVGVRIEGPHVFFDASEGP